ncbi:MAG: LPS export ABC transporter periplasmic protein LptC [Bacteroidales bacterium]|nr:LPS export ABC transporter periplasmic protein LptC [Bacteroidales bacterium]
MKRFILITIVIGALVSCKGADVDIPPIDFTVTPVQSVEGMVARRFQWGDLTYDMRAGLMERFEYSRNDTLYSYELYSNGFEVLGYTVDGLLETQINADGARHNTVAGQEQWLAFGNVHIQNLMKGEHSLTDTIYWDRDHKRIYTDCFIQMYSPQGLMQGYGMESDEKADNAVIRHPFDSYGIDRDSTYFYFDSVNFVGPLQRF